MLDVMRQLFLLLILSCSLCAAETLPREDGTLITYYIDRPQVAEYPLAVILQGSECLTVAHKYDTLIRPLTEAGVAVLRVEKPGLSEYVLVGECPEGAMIAALASPLLEDTQGMVLLSAGGGLSFADFGRAADASHERLIVQGQDDVSTPLESGLALKQQLEESGREHFEFRTYKGGHAPPPEVLQASVQWLISRLQGPSAVPQIPRQ